jgi:hypothetical protein
MSPTSYRCSTSRYNVIVISIAKWSAKVRAGTIPAKSFLKKLINSPKKKKGPRIEIQPCLIQYSMKNHLLDAVKEQMVAEEQ